MVIKNLKYIKIGFYIPFIIILGWISYIIFLYKTSHPTSLIIPVLILFFTFSTTLNIGNELVQMELNRRIFKIPVAKRSFFSWNNNSIGISFIEPEKNTFWYCGSDTNFEIHIMSIEEVKSQEFDYYIVFTNTKNHKRYTVYKFNSQ